MNSEIKKIILIVEDEIALQEAIRLKLENDKSINVVTAGSGEEALVLIRERKPDLIWLDLLMPKMSGLELMKIIREDDNLKDLKVFVVSASGGSDNEKKARDLGALDYFIKGNDTLDAIIERLKSFLI